MATLLLDDQRNIPADRVARTYKEGIESLREQHWDLLYLDHNLGDFSGAEGRELTGYDVACWLEENLNFFRTESKSSRAIRQADETSSWPRSDVADECDSALTCGESPEASESS